MSSLNKQYEDKFVSGISQFTEFIIDIVSVASKNKYTELNANAIAFAAGFANSKIKEFGNKYATDQFIIKSNKYWKNIYERDIDVLKNHLSEMCPLIPTNILDQFVQLCVGKTQSGKSYIDSDDMDALWDFVFNFIKISIQYIHYNRKPEYSEAKSESKTPTFTYTANFFPDVKVGEMVKLYNVKLS
jgi:hypothetical protein